MTDAESILRNVLDKIIEQLQYKHAEISLKEVTSGGANYTSAIFAINVAAPDQDTLKLFAKVATVSGVFRKLMKIESLFKTEQFVYSDLVQVYEKIQDEHKLSSEHRFEFPKFFGGEAAEGEETIVMEDLRAKGFESYSRFKPIDWEHSACAIEHLARFHALSFAYQKEYPEEFAKAAELVKTKETEELEVEKMTDTWSKMVTSAIDVAKEAHKERLTKLLRADDSRYAFQKFKAPLSTVVLCHGDYRVSNLLFRRLDGRLDPVVVDYQTVHSGCPVTDLLYFEFLGTDWQFRREYHQKLIDHYFEQLTIALDRLGIDVNDVYPRETFDKEYKTMSTLALCIAMAVLPLVLVEADQAPHMSGMKDVKDLAVSPSELFAERYSDLVSDCVEWGAI